MALSFYNDHARVNASILQRTSIPREWILFYIPPIQTWAIPLKVFTYLRFHGFILLGDKTLGDGGRRLSGTRFIANKLGINDMRVGFYTHLVSSLLVWRTYCEESLLLTHEDRPQNDVYDNKVEETIPQQVSDRINVIH